MTVAENVAVLTVVLEDAEVTEATEATEVAAEAVDGAEAERMRRRSGCLALSWAVWFSRYNDNHSPNDQMRPDQKLQAVFNIKDCLSNCSRVFQIAANTVRWTSRAQSSGEMVLQGKIKSLEQIYLFSMPVKEYQIVESFLGSALKDEVMKIMPVQKQTRAGQRTRFKAFVVVGDHNGHVGLGVKCAKEVSAAAAICTLWCIWVFCLAYHTVREAGQPTGPALLSDSDQWQLSRSIHPCQEVLIPFGPADTKQW